MRIQGKKGIKQPIAYWLIDAPPWIWKADLYFLHEVQHSNPKSLAIPFTPSLLKFPSL
jgi:hypothetical protein